HCESVTLWFTSIPALRDRKLAGRKVRYGLTLTKRLPCRSVPTTQNVLNDTALRSSEFTYCQYDCVGLWYAPGPPPRVARSSNVRAMAVKPMPVPQLFTNVQCALMLPPLSRRSPPKFQLLHSFRSNRKLRTRLPGLSCRHCSQLLMDRRSARRM